MTHIKLSTFALVLLGISFQMSGCTQEQPLPPHKGGFYYRDIYFGKVNHPMYQAGIRDGCETARGFYTKSHNHFKQSSNYHEGWFLGRNRCRKLLRIDKNGDLIQ